MTPSKHSLIATSYRLLHSDLLFRFSSHSPLPTPLLSRARVVFAFSNLNFHSEQRALPSNEPWSVVQGSVGRFVLATYNGLDFTRFLVFPFPPKDFVSTGWDLEDPSKLFQKNCFVNQTVRGGNVPARVCPILSDHR